MEAPCCKKRQRKSCQHCERKRAVIDKLESDLEDKDAQLKELSEIFGRLEKEKGEQEFAGALEEEKTCVFLLKTFVTRTT